MTMRTGVLVSTVAAMTSMAGTLLAQDPETGLPSGTRFVPGMVLDDSGGWRAPTGAEALQIFRGDRAMLPYAGDHRAPAISVLRQRLGPRSVAELDELANTLAGLILASTPDDGSEAYFTQRDAFTVLGSAARSSGPGVPHPGAFDILVRVYETIAAEALADGGEDPVSVLGPKKGGGYLRLRRAFSAIYEADREGRGADYLLALISSSEPPDPNRENWYEFPYSVWCDAAELLRGTGEAVKNPRRSELPDEALDDQLFYQLCSLH